MKPRDITTSMLGVVQKAFYCGKSTTKKFLGRSRVNKHCRCNPHNGRQVKEGLELELELGAYIWNLINKRVSR